MTMTTMSNPFPKGTVVSESIAGLPIYMGESYEQARTQVDIYKENFSARELEHGHAAGIKGRFGSGKTHLTFQLIERFTSDTIRPCKAIYAKLDHVDIVDLYKNHFARKLTDEDLTRLVAMHVESLLRADAAQPESPRQSRGEESLRAVARAEVTRTAKDNPEYVLDLLRNDLLPVSGLGLALDKEIEDTASDKQLGRDFVRAYSRLKDPAYSRMAMRWIRGDVLSKAERDDLGLDIAGIEQPSHAKEAMQFLLDAYRKAGVPILFAIDECERFSVRGTPDDRAAAPGLLKDLAEIFKRTGHFLLVVGADPMWNAMSPDFFDRVKREYIVEARLSPQEATDLIDAYCSVTGKRVSELFEPDAVRILGETSEYNVRRLLHIAHEAFAAASASSSSLVQPEHVIRAADRALNAPDRLSKLHDSIPSVARRLQLGVVKDFQKEQVKFDYALGATDQPSVLVQITQAVHRRDEVNRSREAADAFRAIRAELPNSRTCAVVVGYSTPEVRAGLNDVVDALIVYDEDQFERQFEDVVRAAQKRTGDAHAQPNDAAYAQFQARFDALARERQAELERLTNTVAALQAQITRRSQEEREVRVSDKFRTTVELLREMVKNEQAMALDPYEGEGRYADALRLLDEQREALHRLEVLNAPLTAAQQLVPTIHEYRLMLEVAETDWEKIRTHNLSRTPLQVRDAYRQRLEVLQSLALKHENRHSGPAFTMVPQARRLIVLATGLVAAIYVGYQTYQIRLQQATTVEEYVAAQRSVRDLAGQVVAKGAGGEPRMTAESLATSKFGVDKSAADLRASGVVGQDLDNSYRQTSVTTTALVSGLRNGSAVESNGNDVVAAANAAIEAARSLPTLGQTVWSAIDVGGVQIGLVLIALSLFVLSWPRLIDSLTRMVIR